jgi:hypothetical protein
MNICKYAMMWALLDMKLTCLISCLFHQVDQHTAKEVERSSEREGDLGERN